MSGTPPHSIEMSQTGGLRFYIFYWPKSAWSCWIPDPSLQPEKKFWIQHCKWSKRNTDAMVLHNKKFRRSIIGPTYQLRISGSLQLKCILSKKIVWITKNRALQRHRHWSYWYWSCLSNLTGLSDNTVIVKCIVPFKSKQLWLKFIIFLNKFWNVFHRKQWFKYRFFNRKYYFEALKFKAFSGI